MKIRFYLKRADSKKETAIYALVNWAGNSLKIYTAESIHPRNWNSETQQARNTPRFPEHPEFNERLIKIRSDISKVFHDYKEKKGALPSPAALKQLIEEAQKKKKVAFNFIEYFEDFISRSLAGERIDQKSKKPVGVGVTRGYTTTLGWIKEYAKTSRRKVDFDTIDLEFHTDFTAFLNRQQLSANAIGSHFQRIKAVLYEATRRKINTNDAYQSPHFIKQSEPSDSIYLDKEELEELRHFPLDPVKDKRLDNVRDLFLIGCYSGLRHSDFNLLTPEKIKDGFIRIIQQKTGEPVTIPVHHIVAEILQKRDGATPKPISNEKMNVYLKELGRKIPGLQKTISRTITRGGFKVTTYHKKWERLTTHTARRSFATNEYKAGTPTLVIMAVTGHKTEKSFLKYIRVTQEDNARILKSIWAAREMKAV